MANLVEEAEPVVFEEFIPETTGGKPHRIHGGNEKKWWKALLIAAAIVLIALAIAYLARNPPKWSSDSGSGGGGAGAGGAAHVAAHM